MPFSKIQTCSFALRNNCYSFRFLVFFPQRNKTIRSRTNIKYNKLSTDAETSDLELKKTLSVPADDEKIPINENIPYRDDVDDDDDNDSVNESQNHQISFYT